MRKSVIYLASALCGLAALGFSPVSSEAAGCHWDCETLICSADGACTGSNCTYHCS